MIAKSLLQECGAEEVCIFYSYARKDIELRNEVERSLSGFDWDVAVRVWHDGEISPGDEWEREIDKNLAAADIVLLFVTQAFVDSEYCRQTELPAALERHGRGEARVVPVLLEETEPSWRGLDLARLQVLPRNEVPISEWTNRRLALEDVGQGLVDLVVREGLLPLSRWRWELRLDADLPEWKADDQRRVVEGLRELTADKTLRVVSRSAGSVVLTVESTSDAMAKVQQEFDSGDLPEWVGIAVLQIERLFGAGVHASTKTVGADIERPATLPDSDNMVLPTRAFVPAHIKGLALDKESPIQSMKWTLDTGDTGLRGEAFETETKKLIDFFLTCIAVPEEDLFVNLAPDENVRLLSDTLSGTRMGASFLEFDYRLKRLCASLLHPDLESGKAYWEEARRRCRAELPGHDVPLSAFQRVWIVPEKAAIYESTRAAMEHLLSGGPVDDAPTGEDGSMSSFVIESHLKAETEREMLGGAPEPDSTQDRVAQICDEVFRDLVLPLIEREVNEGEGFNEFQQIYRAIILATWFKNKFSDHPKVARFIDSKNPGQLGVQITGIESTGKRGDGTPSKAQAERPEVAAESPAEAPPVLEDLFQRAIAAREAGETGESIAELERVLEARDAAVGRMHHDTLVALSQLGRSKLAAGAADGAREHHEEVLATRMKTLGKDHPHTHNSMAVLATTLLACGEDTRARRLQADAAELRIRASEGFKLPENREYFDRYMDVFRNGVVYVERVEYDSETRKKVHRAYFTGAIDLRDTAASLRRMLPGPR